jgi:hypothetical protein
LQVTYGESKAKRPALKQCVLSTLCVDRAVPIWGKPEDGKASDKSLTTTRLSEMAQLLACQGVAPGASIDMAEAALVTEDHRAALGAPLFIPRLPATYRECGRVMAEAVARHQWEVVGVLAQTPPTKHRPGTFYQVAADVVPRYGQTSRAVVVYSSHHEPRRPQRVEREVQASSTTLAPTGRTAAKQAYCCRADAEAAAEQLRALQSASHRVAVVSEARPQYGPGRPSQPPPRVGKARRYGLQGTRHERAEVVARKRQEAGCFVLLTHVPTAGERAHRAGEGLQAYKEQHGGENYQPCNLLKIHLWVSVSARGVSRSVACCVRSAAGRVHRHRPVSTTAGGTLWSLGVP